MNYWQTASLSSKLKLNIEYLNLGTKPFEGFLNYSLDDAGRS